MFKFLRFIFGRKKPLLSYDGNISSPDGRIICNIRLEDGQVYYSVYKDNKIIKDKIYS